MRRRIWAPVLTVMLAAACSSEGPMGAEQVTVEASSADAYQSCSYAEGSITARCTDQQEAINLAGNYEDSGYECSITHDYYDPWPEAGGWDTWIVECTYKSGGGWA